MSCAGRSALRSLTRSSPSSASRPATAPGSRTGISPSTCITFDGAQVTADRPGGRGSPGHLPAGPPRVHHRASGSPRLRGLPSPRRRSATSDSFRAATAPPARAAPRPGRRYPRRGPDGARPRGQVPRSRTSMTSMVKSGKRRTGSPTSGAFQRGRGKRPPAWRGEAPPPRQHPSIQPSTQVAAVERVNSALRTPQPLLRHRLLPQPQGLEGLDSVEQFRHQRSFPSRHLIGIQKDRPAVVALSTPCPQPRMWPRVTSPRSRSSSTSRL